MSNRQSSKTHVLFTTADRDAPDCIRDGNGEVVLGLCKVCGRGEVELSEPCGQAEHSHPILSAAPSFDHLDPIGEDAERHQARVRDHYARLPFEAAAHRFIHTPGPAELAGKVAGNRLQHGDRTFGVGLGGLTLTMVGVFAATLLRHFGIC